MEEYLENEIIEETEEIEEEPKPILYVLNLNEDNRILSACYDNEYIDKDLARVETLPNGDLYDYLYIEGEYIYLPILESEV